MSFLYIAGLSSNLVTSATLSSSSADSNFPLTNLQKDYAWQMFQFGSAALDDTLTADLGSATPVTFSSVHFHNIDAGVTSVQLLSDDNSGFTTPTTRATFTVGDPSFFASFSAGASERYWRIKFNGTNGSAIYVGKWVLAVSSSLTEIQLSDWNIRYEMEQLEAHREIRINQSLFARRVLSLPFINTTDAAKDEVLTMLDDSGWGAGPIVAVPDSTEAMVVYGRSPNSLDVARGPGGSGNSRYEHSLIIEEDRFPVVVT